MSTTCTTVDAGVLRKALRLVHCIQKERGASCAASSAILQARKDSDRAFDMLLPAESNDVNDCVEKITLEKIRTMVEELLENDAEDTASSSFHLILLSFNTLIQSLVHKYIVRYTEAGKIWAENRSRHPSQKGGGGMVHSHSHHALLNEQMETESPLQYRHKRIYSTGASPILPRSDPESSGRILPPPLTVGEDSFDLQDSLHSTRSSDYFEGTDDEERVMRLLNLLDTFVRLKESTGRERAALSSILVQAENNLMMNDLVLEVENQRRQVDNLKRLLPKTGVWHDLVSELVSMSPEMKRLQNSIFKGFDLDSFRTTFDSQGELWNLLTLYINKLHSLELLIVEEIENCIGVRSGDNILLVSDASNLIPEPNASRDGRNNSMTTRVLSEALGLSGVNVRQQIEAMSPDEIKQRLLDISSLNRHENTNGKDHVVEAVSGKGVEDLLSELSVRPASKEWEINLYEIRFIKRIGEGSAGTTFLADWSGLNVAVKVASISEMGLEGWRTEVQQLQKLHHPNIIRLLGSVYHPTPLTFCLVLEYCDAGDLLGYLHKVTPPNFFFHVAMSVAKGMTYLHSRGIIHRDIKPENVLLEGDVASGHFNVKVTDFGVATEASSGNRTAETGTYRWMAPEVIRHESYGQSADVYSAAVVMWQLITREEPFAKKGQVEAAAAVALENARPPFPTETPAKIVKLIETCWSVDPEERYSFEEIAIELQEIEKWMNLKDKTWIEAPLGHASVQVPKAEAAETQELDLSQVQHAAPGGKKKKGFRKILFNRKSAHF